MMTLKIDEGFQNLLPPLDEHEFKFLEEKIVSDGEIFTPIYTWNGVIVDGHNRYRILQKYPQIPFKTKEIEFENRDEVESWICKNQLSRRNITDIFRSYAIGKSYECEMRSHGGLREKSVSAARDQIGPLPKIDRSHTTRKRIAKETGTSEGNVERSRMLARGVDAAEEIETGLKNKILKGEIKVKKSDLQAIGKAPEEQRSKLVKDLRKPKKERTKPSYTKSERDEVIRSLTTPKGQVTADETLGTIYGAGKDYKNVCNIYIEKFPELLGSKRSNLLEVMREVKDFIEEIEKGII